MAAGLEVKSGELDTFKVNFNAAVKENLSDADLSPVQHIDAELSGDQRLLFEECEPACCRGIIVCQGIVDLR